ncbi:MAG: PD-(D/E)XK nuclease family protein [Reichenbachiella sp.]|uniref:PD-(D/E)XK nuclease family protein n=1 Tax=Reichenbachiella sp. TaxID=2184521 RepID=UPI0032979FB6
MSFDYNQIETFLKLDLPDTVDHIDTFLDVAGFPHYENVISNIYSYYFDSKKSHGLDDLFLKSLIGVVRKKSKLVKEGDPFINRLQYLDNWGEWSVRREESVDRKRIDIVLEETSAAESTFIIIENKIYAGLNNPLDTYWKIDEKSDRKVGVVLSIYEENITHEGFINILHKELLNEVKNYLGHYIESAKQRDIAIVKDTIINLKQLEGMSQDTKQILEFYHIHKTKIESVFDLRNEVRLEFLNAVQSLGKDQLEQNVLYPRATDYRCIADSEFEDLLLTFYFNDSVDDDNSAFSISVELGKSLITSAKEIAQDSKIFKAHEKNGIKKYPDGADSEWYVLATKYYFFEDIDYDLSKLKDVFEKDWKPFIDDVKKMIK